MFDKVNENSQEVWKWEMYRLASEYDSKPGLAPPLVIIEDGKQTNKRDTSPIDPFSSA